MNNNNNIVIFFILFISIISAFIMKDNMDNEVTYVKSTVDNNEYLVRKCINQEDSIKSANLLATIRKKLILLCKYCQNKYKNNDSVKRLVNKFNPNSLSETGKNSKYTSYSVNKGDKIVLCLRSRDKHERLIDINTLTFVAIHELAHVMTISVGHNDEFWDNFRFLLNNAIEAHIYENINYNDHPKKYCGIVVSDNPLYS